jgi:hypothetical protein
VSSLPRILALVVAGALAVPCVFAQATPAPTEDSGKKKKKKSAEQGVGGAGNETAGQAPASPSQAAQAQVTGAGPQAGSGAAPGAGNPQRGGQQSAAGGKVIIYPPKANDQTFSIPPNALPAPPDEPDVDSSSVIPWLLGLTIALFLTMGVLIWARMTLKRRPGLGREQAMESLLGDLNQLSRRARQAKQIFEDARDQIERSPATAAPRESAPREAAPTPRRGYEQPTLQASPPQPQTSQSSYVDEPPVVRKGSSTTQPLSPAVSSRPPERRPSNPKSSAQPQYSSVVAAYERVRVSNDNREIDRFDETYRYTRVSCPNFDDLRTNPSAILKFEAAQRGALLVVEQSGATLAFPWFATDLLQGRDRLEGIFQYVDAGSSSLCVTQPALLDRQGSYWIMRDPGRVEAHE